MLAAGRDFAENDVMWEMEVQEEAVMEMAPHGNRRRVGPKVIWDNGMDETAQSSEAPRLRQYFPETMLWLPDAVTDKNGQLELDFPVADSITTWRLTALASSQDGQLGSVFCAPACLPGLFCRS